MNKLLSHLKEIFSKFSAEFVHKGYKSSAAEEVPVSSCSKLKILAAILKGTIERNPTDFKALYIG
jgi:hypothetical protein